MKDDISSTCINLDNLSGSSLLLEMLILPHTKQIDCMSDLCDPYFIKNLVVQLIGSCFRQALIFVVVVQPQFNCTGSPACGSHFQCICPLCFDTIALLDKRYLYVQ